MKDHFDALVLRERGDGVSAAVEGLEKSDLPADGNVLVHIAFSSLNYKDALAVTGEGKIVRASYPFVPGIDLAGRVVESASARFAEGDLIVGTGGGLGESRWGGYSEFQRVSDRWLVALPENLSLRGAMAIGTAGFTAMFSLIQMERMGQTPDLGPVAVTGATGGVGSIAVLLFSRAGYEVVASTGKKSAEAYLRGLGAADVIDRNDLGAGARKPLDSARWGGAVDSVGGSTLEAIVSQTNRHGNVAVCGLAGGSRLETTVFPLILRGVSLLGIDSNTCPLPVRERAWSRLGEMLDQPTLDGLTETIALGDVLHWSRELLGGAVTGRVLIRISGD